ncbi:MAG: hypothetical protein ACJAU6_003861, partial [Alphaproteobacteria bacterium]
MSEMFAPLSEQEVSATPPPDGKPKKQAIVPVPDDAPLMQFRHPKHGAPSVSWAYHDAQSLLVGHICRWDIRDANGNPDKIILPVTYCELDNGQRAWRSAGFPDPRPLYRLPNILAKSGARVLVVEGEKACDAAVTLFPDAVATTPAHGAKSPAKTDWGPVQGRSVVIWPDHDTVGREYARTVLELVKDAGAVDVRIVEIPSEFPEKWDLADALPDGWTEDRLRGLLDAPNNDNGVSTARTPFRLKPDGVYRLVEKEDKTTHEISKEWKRFCSSLEVAAETRDVDGENWGRLLVVKDRDGVEHEWALPMELLAGSGEEYRRHLLSMGLVMAPGKFARDSLHEYLSTARPNCRARCVTRVGWHNQAFVLPDEAFGNTQGERVLLQSIRTLDHAFKVRGSPDDWQQNVAQYAEGNSRLAFSLAAAFAAALLGPCGAESGGFHFRGASSIGKSTAMIVAGSVWGGGTVKGYTRTWRATDNGLEAVAQAHCDALLCLDEMSQVDGKAAAAAAYMLANGAGKSRAGRGGEGRKPAEWRVLFLSNGEISLSDKLAEDRRVRKIAAGQEVRVIDMPAAAGVGLGAFENIHRFDSPDAFARHIKRAASEYYGTSIRAFLKLISSDLDAVRKSVVGFKVDFIDAHC